MNKSYILRYRAPAPTVNDGMSALNWSQTDLLDDSEDGWEKWSLPIANGYFGACVFGRTDIERIQITENSFANCFYENNCGGGLNNLAEIYIHFQHENVTEYERGLDISNALTYTKYSCNGVKYMREMFADYPGRVMAAKFTAGTRGALSFTVRAESPFDGDFCIEPGDGLKKSSTVSAENHTIVLDAVLHHYHVHGQLRIGVDSDGEVLADAAGGFTVKSATYAVLYITAATNYRIDSQVFCETDPVKKLNGFPEPGEITVPVLERAVSKGYELLREEHLADYHTLFNRVSFDLGGCDTGGDTDVLITDYRNGLRSRYLEEMVFQFGRYLLICSSRIDCLPANLQGIWNRYSDAPWSAGYWHNINIQMNYWPACCCNLSELFLAYCNYFKAYLPLARQKADEFIKEYFPESYAGEGKNGWSIGTGAWPYDIYGIKIDDHSGPGTGAMTALLFWDYFDYTRDYRALREIVYPALYEASLFLSKVMILKEGKWLVRYSASPEQIQDGKYYRTTGCAFDQQMAYELFRDTIRAAELVGDGTDALITTLRERVDMLDPFMIGASGQIKEYREETFYGEIGEKPHRHLSHLTGFYPGISVGIENQDLLSAAATTLTFRGKYGEAGWPAAHRLLVWTRIGSAFESYETLKKFISCYLLPNLWAGYPVFQIDANFGIAAGIAEMLLQSHTGTLHLLPAVPDEWKDGSFTGLLTRGGFEVSVSWKEKRIASLAVVSTAGGELRLNTRGAGITGALCNGKNAPFKTEGDTLILQTQKGERYAFLFSV